jgi:hypothetical protein
MISTRSVGLLIDTVVCLTLAKWEPVSGRFGGYLRDEFNVTDCAAQANFAGTVTGGGSNRYKVRYDTCGVSAGTLALTPWF